MSYAAQHAVVRPYGEIVFASFSKLPCVVQKQLLPLFLINMENETEGRVEFPYAFGHIFFSDEGERRRMFSLVVDEEDRMEYLHGIVGVHSGTDLGYRTEIPVDEFAESAVVVDCPGS